MDARPGCARVSASIVPPQPISRSSECAADREHAPQGRIAARDASTRITRAVDSAASRPTWRHGARPDVEQPLEPLPVLDRVHRPEEPFVAIRDHFAARNELRERLLDELVARLDPVEDLAPHDEEAAVDPDARRVHVLDRP